MKISKLTICMFVLLFTLSELNAQENSNISNNGKINITVFENGDKTLDTTFYSEDEIDSEQIDNILSEWCTFEHNIDIEEGENFQTFKINCDVDENESGTKTIVKKICIIKGNNEDSNEIHSVTENVIVKNFNMDVESEIIEDDSINVVVFVVGDCDKNVVTTKTDEHVKVIHVSDDGAESEMQFITIECEADSAENENIEIKVNCNNDFVWKTSKKSHIVIKSIDKKERKSLNKKIELPEKDNLNIEHLSFFPNPNSGKFNLKFTLPETGDTNINIYSSNGKTVFSEKLPAFTGEYSKKLDISKNGKGLYIIKIEQNNKVLAKKIIVD